VVAGLLRSQSADGRKDTKGIASQHDDVAGLTVDDTRDLSVGDKLNRVGATSVLSDADIFVVRNAGCRVVDDVLKDTAISDGVENIRLLLCGQVDTLGVTSALNVEDTSVRPDMFVVADEKTARVSGECSFASTGKAEKEGNITLLNADICRGVKRKLTEFDGLEVMLERWYQWKIAKTISWKHTMTEKTPFFISPAYSVPRMTISIRLKFISTEVVELMPFVKRLAGN
jgi:hypothetical protein